MFAVAPGGPDPFAMAPHDYTLDAALRVSVKTGSALVRVCRAFRVLALPLLYTAVVVHDGRSARRLARTLSKTEMPLRALLVRAPACRAVLLTETLDSLALVSCPLYSQFTAY